MRCLPFALVTLWFFSHAGCGSAPPRVVPESPATDSSRVALENFDSDKSGLLDEKELANSPGLRAGLKQADSNGDGAFAPHEIDQRIKAWADSRVGRMTVACIISYRGTPLANAEVKLVPEPFLGTNLQTATGTTNDQGLAFPSAPETDDKPPGVAPGYYRVEITAAGRQLPAKYNSATTLGIEVASDATDLIAGPVKFDLQ